MWKREKFQNQEKRYCEVIAKLVGKRRSDVGRVSMPTGKGSSMHNRRDYAKYGRSIPKNIDSARTVNNIVLADMELEDAYRLIFDDAVENYNKRQKRNDRKINDYLNQIKHSKNGEKPFYEDVIQWGAKDDFERNPQLWEIAKDCLEEYIQGWHDRNPNLFLIGAYIHMDEASPHAHLDYIPVATGYSIGLEKRNSISKALKEMGFRAERESKTNNVELAWKTRERNVFRNICQAHGLEVEAKRTLNEVRIRSGKVQADLELVRAVKDLAKTFQNGKYADNPIEMIRILNNTKDKER